MASSTFKSVSDTIRSKAQIFYVDTERPDSLSPAKITDGDAHEHRPSILSSLRSRSSRNKLNDDFQYPVTTATQASDMPHEIHVDIPDSTLLETLGLTRKGTSTEKVPSNVPPTTFSPLEEASSRISTDMPASPISLKAFIIDATADTKQMNAKLSEDDVLHTNDKHPYLEAGFPDEKDCGNDLGSVCDKGSPGTPSVANADHITTSPQATISSIRSHLGGNLFVKGNREQTRKFGTPSPYRRALQLSEEAASESSACNSDGTHEVEKDSQEDRVSSRPPLKLTTSISSGLNGLVMIFPTQIRSASTAEIEHNSSEAYDADEEYGSERSEEPSMGPKSSWEKARAERQRRYHFVRTMSAETASDCSDVSALELRPMQDQLQTRNNASNLTPKCEFSTATPSSNRRVHFESPLNPTEFSQVPMPISQMGTHDSFCGVIPNPVLTEGLKYSVESNERSPGPELELNEREQNVANLEDLNQAFNVRRLLTVSPSRLQENRSPELELHMRTCSAHSDTTSSSCAITTSSQLCYRPVSEESHHVRTNHVRGTSSSISEIDQVRHDSQRNKPDLAPPISPPLIEGHGCFGINEVPVVVREDAVSPPAHAVKPLNSVVNHSMFTTPAETTKETITSPPNYELSRESCFGGRRSGYTFNDFSAEMLPLLPESGITPYIESMVDIKIDRPMPGAFVPSPEMQPLRSSSRSGQEDHNRRDSPNLPVSMHDRRPCSVDFSMMNPEIDHYLAQAFSDVPFRRTESEYSDEEDGFRTPITTPAKQDHRAESRSGSWTKLLSSRSHLSGQTTRIYQLRDTSNAFVAARLPEFAATPADNIESPAEVEGLISAYNEYTLDGVRIPNENPPPVSLSGRSHSRDRSWQMKDISYDGEESTAHSVDSPHTQLQTSSLKKGVWWTRAQEMLMESESPCAQRPMLQNLDDDLDNAKNTLRSVEESINESNMNIDDLRALLAGKYIQEQRDEPDSSSTELQADGWEDDNPAIATEKYLTVENGIQQNRQSISDINAFRATATPFVTECTFKQGLDQTMRDAKKGIPWNDGPATTKYQVRAPTVVEDSLSAADFVQQDQDADDFATLFSRSNSPFKGFQTLHQEIKTAMESLQGEEMVSTDEPNSYIVGSLPRAMRHDRLRSSEDSWYSFGMG
ncbi:hypothetical protein MMC18_003361 [Xylographa bjoerkii]|nr:hypothetical protein [Xylographa bjoerkii]